MQTIEREVALDLDDIQGALLRHRRSFTAYTCFTAWMRLLRPKLR